MTATDTRLARIVLDRLVIRFSGAADPATAVSMRAYMRDGFPFLGLPSPRRRELGKQVVAGLPRPGATDLHAVALACWELPEREYQYFACDLLTRHARVLGPGFLH